MADTGNMHAGNLNPSWTGGSNGGATRLSDDNASTITQTFSFSGATQTFYAYNFTGTDIPSGATIDGAELVINMRYDSSVGIAHDVYFGIAHDGDGTSSGAASATFSDVADGGTGYTGTTQQDDGTTITGDGGTALFDLTDAHQTKTFGSPTTTWNLAWPTTGLDLSDFVVKVVTGWDISSGTYLTDWAEMDVKIYYTEPVGLPKPTVKIASGTLTLKGGNLTIK